MIMSNNDWQDRMFELDDIVRLVKLEAQNFYDKNNKSAGTRARKGLSELAKFCANERKLIQDKKNNPDPQVQEIQMDPILHTVLALATIYIAWRVGRVQRRRQDIERYTEHLEKEGFVYIERMKDGSYEFIKHWKQQQQN